jgi:hypothetical protein
MDGPVNEVISFQEIEQTRCLPPHLRTETDPVSETMCSRFFKMPDYGQTSKTQ